MYVCVSDEVTNRCEVLCVFQMRSPTGVRVFQMRSQTGVRFCVSVSDAVTNRCKVLCFR